MKTLQFPSTPSLTDAVLRDLFNYIPKSLNELPQDASPLTTQPADSGRDSSAGSGNPGLNYEVLFRIETAARISFELDKLTNEEIAQMILDTIWTQARTGTLEGELADQAIMRLRRCSGGLHG